jgi:hypothetical protein
MTIPQDQREAILGKIMGGASMRQACRDLGIDRVLVYADLKADETFANQYARAAEVRADDIFDEIFDIADDGLNDWIERKGDDGNTKGWLENGEAINRSKVRIDTRKWALARMNPRKYGDKVQIGGADDLPPVTINAAALSTAALREIMAATLAKPEPDEG